MLDADKQAAINVFLGIADDRVITGKLPKFGGDDAWYDTNTSNGHCAIDARVQMGCGNLSTQGYHGGGLRLVVSPFAFYELGVAFLNATLELTGYACPIPFMI